MKTFEKVKEIEKAKEQEEIVDLGLSEPEAGEEVVNTIIYPKVWIRPVDRRIANRPLILAGSKLTLFIKKNRNGKWLDNHTEEDWDSYTELELLFMDREERDAFYRDFKIIIPGSGRIFDLNVEIDRFSYKIIQTYPDVVAPNRQEIVDTCMFFIDNPLEKAREHKKRADYLIEALKIYSKMTMTSKVDILTLYGYDHRSLSLEIADGKLFEEIDANPKRFVDYMEKGNDEQRNAMIFLEQCVVERLLKKEGEAYFYESLNIGINIEQAALWARNPKNATIVLNLKQELFKRKKS